MSESSEGRPQPPRNLRSRKQNQAQRLLNSDISLPQSPANLPPGIDPPRLDEPSDADELKGIAGNRHQAYHHEKTFGHSDRLDNRIKGLKGFFTAREDFEKLEADIKELATPDGLKKAKALISGHQRALEEEKNLDRELIMNENRLRSLVEETWVLEELRTLFEGESAKDPENVSEDMRMAWQKLEQKVRQLVGITDEEFVAAETLTAQRELVTTLRGELEAARKTKTELETQILVLEEKLKSRKGEIPANAEKQRLARQLKEAENKLEDCKNHGIDLQHKIDILKAEKAEKETEEPWAANEREVQQGLPSERQELELARSRQEYRADVAEHRVRELEKMILLQQKGVNIDGRWAGYRSTTVETWEQALERVFEGQPTPWTLQM